MDYFSADLHFGHKNILSYCCRPWNTLDDMNEGIIERFNNIVTPQDTLYILGDVSFLSKEKTAELVGRLNGWKVLVIGNHDRKRKVEWWLTIFDEVFDPSYGQTTLYHRSIGSKPAVMSHFPWREHMLGYDNREYLIKHAPPQRKDEILIHGHVHETWQQRDNQINVGVDVWDYQPVSVDVLKVICQLHGL